MLTARENRVLNRLKLLLENNKNLTPVAKCFSADGLTTGNITLPGTGAGYCFSATYAVRRQKEQGCLYTEILKVLSRSTVGQSPVSEIPFNVVCSRVCLCEGVKRIKLK